MRSDQYCQVELDSLTPSMRHLERPQSDGSSVHSGSEYNSEHSTPPTSPSHSGQLDPGSLRISDADLPPMIDFARPYVSELMGRSRPNEGEELERFEYGVDYVEREVDYIVHLVKLGVMRVVNPDVNDEDVWKYKIVKVLGRGGQGIAYRLQSMSPDGPSNLVMKVPLVHAHSHEGDIMREIAIARWLGDDRVPALYKSAFPGFYAMRALNPGLRLAIFMEEMRGTLSDFLDELVTEEERRRIHVDYDLAPTEARMVFLARAKIMHQLASTFLVARHALDRMFDRDVVNCDIKPDNVLVDMTGGLRVSDLGMLLTAKELDKGYFPPGTPEYQSPEIIAKIGAHHHRTWKWANEGQWMERAVRTRFNPDLEMWAIGACLISVAYPSLDATAWHTRGEKFLSSLTQRRMMEENLDGFLTQHMPHHEQCYAINDVLSSCFAPAGRRTSMNRLVSELGRVMADELQERVRTVVEYKPHHYDHSLLPDLAAVPHVRTLPLESAEVVERELETYSGGTVRVIPSDDGSSEWMSVPLGASSELKRGDKLKRNWARFTSAFKSLMRRK